MKNIFKSYGNLQILKDFCYSFSTGEFVCICGASGIGKTTILQLLAGLDQPDAGTMECGTPNIGYVFQEPRLIPWCSVLENIEIGLYSIMPDAKSQRKQICEDLARKVGLDGFQKYYPSQLSGGMKQRVSLARAFALEPDILLLDEPFSSLNLELRESMRKYLLELLASKPRTSIMVTHDLEDAVRLADRVIYLRSRPCEIALDFSLTTPVADRDMKFRYQQIEIIESLLN